MKKLIGCFFVFLLGVGATLGYLAWRDRAENRDASQSIVLDLESALATRNDIVARIESARQRDGSSELVISEADLQALAVAAIAGHDHREDWVRVIREVSAEIKENLVELGASVDIDALGRSGLVEAEDLERVLGILPMLRGRELYIGFHGVPGAVNGELALVDDVGVKIGFLSLPLDEIAERFGFSPDRLYTYLLLDLDALVVEEVRALDGELALEVRARRLRRRK